MATGNQEVTCTFTNYRMFPGHDAEAHGAAMEGIKRTL